MIAPFKFPPLVSLVDNQIVFCFKTNEQILSAGTKAKLIIYFSAVNSNVSGKQFKLRFSGNEITFTSAVTPDGSGEQYPIASPADDNISWMAKISLALHANYYISNGYVVTYNYNQVILTAKNAGAAYNITGEDIAFPLFSILHISFSATAGTDTQVNPFFNVYTQIISGNKILGEDILPVDASGKASFEISEYLRPELSASLTFPETSNTLMHIHNESRVAYYLRYGLYYGSEPKFKKLTDTGIFHALPGGVNSMTEARYHELNTSWYQQLCAKHSFLTHHPLKKRTQPEYMQKIWYLVHNELPIFQGQSPMHTISLKVGLNLLSPSGVPSTIVVTKYTTAVNIFNVIEILCGYNRMQLYMDVPAGYTVVSYDVFLEDATGIISPIFNFYFDLSETGFNRTFLFKNSYKVWETFIARGIKQIEPEYERTQINKIRTIDFTKTSPDKQNYYNLETNKQIVETGNRLTLEEKQWLSELLLSEEVYEVIDDILYPVVITGTSKTPIVDREYLHNVKIEYIHAFTDQHYSVEKSVMAITHGHVVIMEDNSQSTIDLSNHIIMPHINSQVGITEGHSTQVQIALINSGF